MSGSPLAGTGGLVRLVLRGDRVRLPVWVLAQLALVATSAAAVQELYDTPAERAAYAATVGASPASIAFSGPPVALDTLAGITVFEVSQTSVLAVTLMAMFLVVRSTRGEEEAGRAELLRSLPVGPWAPLAAAAVVVAGACAVVGAGTAAVLAGSGLPLAGSLLYGAAIGLLGIAFLGVAAAAAQVTEHARGALGLAGAVLPLATVVRATGDVAGSGLVWLSPIGIAQAVHPYADSQRAWPLLLLAALAAALGVLAVALLRHRDLGAGLLPDRPGPAAAGPLLAATPGLWLRLQRGALLGWAVGLLLGGVTVGSVSGDVQELVEGNEQIAQALGAAGVTGVVDAFLSTVLLVLALVASGATSSSVLRLRAEEASGRAELVVTTGLSRWRWASSAVLVTVLVTLVVVAAGGLGVGLATAVVRSDASQVGRLVLASLAYTPAALVLAGVALLLLGMAPRWAPAVWAALALSFVIGWLGDLLDLPAAVRDVSPFTHVPQVPLERFAVAPVLALLAVAVATGALGLAGLRRRDLGA